MRRGRQRLALPLLLLQLLLLLLAICPSLVSCGRRRVDKCCGPRQFLVLNATRDFECVTSEDREIRERLLDLRADSPRGLPICDGYSYHIQQLWSDATGKIPEDACLEIFFDSHSRQDFPVVVYCNSTALPRFAPRINSLGHSSSSSSLDTVMATLLSAPRILNFRKCCPDDSYYDAEEKFCKPGRPDLQPLFQRLRAPDFVDVRDGPPTCEHVLVDYKVALPDVRLGAAADVTITIPWEGKPKNVTIDRNNGCLDADPSSSSFIVARVCTEADYCKTNPCIRKCCWENAVNTSCLDQSNFDAKNFRTSLASVAASSNAKPAFDTKRYGLFVGKPCELMYVDSLESWEIGSLGEIIVPNNSVSNYADSCLEYMYNNSHVDNGLHAFFCFEDDDKYTSAPPVRYMIIAGLTLTSCVFLLAMLLVYICLPSLQNLHGKTIMCHAASLLIAYACLSIDTIVSLQLLEGINDYVADMACKYLGYAMIFCFHSAFLWLNVMCFDIWWTFGGVQRTGRGTSRRLEQRKRFLGYCAYAWGLAFLLTGLVAAFDHAGLLTGYGLGRERCWFDYKSYAEVVFFISPITITLVVNTTFFIVTARRCSKVKAEIKRAMANVKDPTSRKFHSDKTRLIMNLKLFVVMGIPWLLENLTAYLSHYYLRPAWLEEIVFVADVVNSLQGLWIFILFVLKPKVYRALRKRFGASGKSLGRGKSSNNLNVNTYSRNIQKSGSSTTLTSNFFLSSSDK